MKSLLLTSLVCIPVLALADDKPAAPAAPVFKPLAAPITLKDGDTFVFLGDSITHQCQYSQYVENYFYTRQPNDRIRFHNAGVGGDRANDALVRFDDDVAAYKPKAVSILLGMNDGSYRDFDKAIFDTYQKDMIAVLDRIESLGALAIPMTPTMHDARAARLAKRVLEPRDTYYNGVLSLYGSWLREQAHVRGLGFVDMWAPLNNLTQLKRRTDANWTMIKDAIHPGPVGQAVMAVAFIQDAVGHSGVSTVTVELAGEKITARGQKTTITDAKRDGENIQFTAQNQALPWVLTPDTAEAIELTKYPHKHSAQRVIVGGLAPGKYTLKIDGAELGTYPHAAFAKGIEIQANEKSPDYQQAMAVAQLNKKRNDEGMRPLRDQYSQLKQRRRTLEKAVKENAPDLEAKRAEFADWHGKMKATVTALEAKAKSYEDQIYSGNKPQPHRYEIAPAK